MQDALTQLRERLGEVSDLGSAATLLDWDQETTMPAGGAAARAEATATVRRLAHERFTDPALGELLESLREHEGSLPPDSDDASLVRVARRRHEKARRVPAELAGELARAESLGQRAWQAARDASDFAALRPALERNVALAQEYAACFGDAAEPYDALLDDYEEGMTGAEVAAVFADLREALVPLAAAIAGRDATPPGLTGPFALERQQALVREVVGRLGWNEQAWRLDDSAHPFSAPVGAGDVRITTRYDEDHLQSVLAALHETGHGLYAQGIDPALRRTPLGSSPSMALDESQSRLWENVVGRGRPFVGYLHGLLAEAFPEALADVDADGLYRSLNSVSPSLIRVEADEVTYSLHVVLRFELERELISGDLAVADLPEAWNAGMRRLLGVEVPDDARGVLQDVHWAAGLFGYFPTYALGNVVALQVWERAREDLPGLDAELAQGDCAALGEWLREHLYRHGAKYTPAETIERVTGGPLDPAPLSRYLAAKYGELYRLDTIPSPTN
ncbi:MAG: carboxypeptidase M32 [Thermoleophilaceae bacterium]